VNYQNAVEKYGLPDSDTRMQYGIEYRTLSGECENCGKDVERQTPILDSASTEAQRMKMTWQEAIASSFRTLCNDCIFSKEE